MKVKHMMWKKLIPLVMAVILGFSLSATAFAAENEPATYQTSDGITVETTVSESDLNDMPESMKLELLDGDNTVVSVTTTYFDLETKTESRAVMPESDFKMTVSAARQEGRQWDGKDCFKLIATGEWIVNPNFEFTDGIGLTWSDDFTLTSDDGYTYNYSSGYRDRSTMTLNDMSPEQGFAYDVNLQLFNRQNEITIVGIVYQNDSSGSANFCGSYGHVIIAPSSIDVSFSSGKEVSFGVGFASAVEKASPDYGSFDY